MRGETRKEVKGATKQLLLQILSWAIITSIGVASGTVVGLAVVRTDLSNALSRIQSLESSSANKDVVAVQFQSMNEKMADIKNGVDYLIRIHVKQ